MDDRSVLMEFYFATNGPSWKINYDWDTESSLSKWHGVTVNAAGRVVELHLPDNGLEGETSLFYSLKSNHQYLQEYRKTNFQLAIQFASVNALVRRGCILHNVSESQAPYSFLLPAPVKPEIEKFQISSFFVA